MPSTAARQWRMCWRASRRRMPDLQTFLVVLTIAVALFFDFTNGFHDTANAIGTAIGTRALPPRLAVGLSAALNLVGAIVTTQLLHAEVANTVGSLVAPAGGVAMSMLIAVLFGAITWNLFTWRAGLPSSSSHALIGALIGMGLTAYGIDAVQWEEVYPVFIALITSPVAGLFIAYAFTVVLLNLLRRARPSQANSAFRRLQLFSSSFVAFSHGANDAQKTMAIITLALFSSGYLSEFAVPTWVAYAAALAIGLGTWAGGWRIIRTMGTRIVREHDEGGVGLRNGRRSPPLIQRRALGCCPSYRMGMDLPHSRLGSPRRLSCAPRKSRTVRGHACRSHSGDRVTRYLRAVDAERTGERQETFRPVNEINYCENAAGDFPAG